MSNDYDAMVAQIEGMVSACKPILRGHAPEVQSAALAELTALWLAGYPDFVRIEKFMSFCGLAKDLLPGVESELYRGGGHPQNKGLEGGGLWLE